VAQRLGLDEKAVRRYLPAARARGVEASCGISALDDGLVAAVVAATHPSDRPAARRWLGGL